MEFYPLVGSSISSCINNDYHCPIYPEIEKFSACHDLYDFTIVSALFPASVGIGAIGVNEIVIAYWMCGTHDWYEALVLSGFGTNKGDNDYFVIHTRHNKKFVRLTHIEIRCCDDYDKA